MLDHKPTAPNGSGNETGAATLATSVYDRLREDVLAGRLRPGEKLRIGPLRRQYGVGATPLREALTRLSVDGLVDHEDQKGFRVAPVSRADMLELARTRCWLEETALRESIANGNDTWEEAVVLAFHRLSRTKRSSRPDSFEPNIDWERRHRAFHMALISACGSRWLLRYCSQLHDQADRYRRIAVVASYPQRDELAEHTAIKNAALDRDTATAIALMHAHYEKTATIIADAIPEPENTQTPSPDVPPVTASA